MRKATPWIVVLVILGGMAAWYYSARETAEDHPSVVSLPSTVTAEAEPEADFPVDEIQAQQMTEPEPLPTLAESDEEVIQALAALIGAESLGAHFVLEHLINRVVATVDSLDSRQLAPLVMPVKPATGEFLVTGVDEITIQAANTSRYSSYVRLANAVDTGQLMELYVHYYPLFQQSYADLGHGDAYFNDRLVEVLDHLLATPEPEGELLLIKPEAVYLFADPEFEALSAGQKLLLRIGSSNAAVVMDKLVEIRSALTQQGL